MTKPFLKWVGGKTQIINTVSQHFPEEIRDYHEFFVGGGSVLFMVLDMINSGKLVVKRNVYAYDSNEALIWVYKNIQSDPEGVGVHLNEITSVYSKLAFESESINRKPASYEEALENKENYYYWMREKYNNIKDKTTLEKSALFIFLNKTCFRGVYREGPNGFNVPFGHYKTSEFLSIENIIEIGELIRHVDFKCADFEESMSGEFTEDDFAYLDPPYAPVKPTSFVSYNEGGFSMDKHLKLFELTKSLPRFLLSNANTKLVTDAFSTTDFNVTIVTCRRAINSKNPESKASEVLISRL